MPRKCIKRICDHCEKEFQTRSKTGKFCSLSCAASKNNLSKAATKKTRKKISESVRRYYQNKPKKERICDKCGNKFVGSVRINRPKHCEQCKRKVPHVKSNAKSLLDYSKRTIGKILSRAKIGCSICGWNEAATDIHHIVPKSEGGSNKNNNLIVLCPNHHRMAHEHRQSFTVEKLQSMSIEETFKDWKTYYNPKR